MTGTSILWGQGSSKRYSTSPLNRIPVAVASKRRTAICVYPYGLRTHDDEAIRNTLDVLADPFAELSSPSMRDEPQAVSAIGKWNDLLDLNQLRNE
jgi:hypothetical protein